MKHLALLPAAMVLLALPASASFHLADNGRSLLLTENGKAVLVYNYAPVHQPGAAEHHNRGAYIHPVFGLNGEVLTQDFPSDHLHHRGFYWAWPQCSVGDRRMDVWHTRDARIVHEEWLKREAGLDSAEIGVQNVWIFDDAPDTPHVRDTVNFVVHPEDNGTRTLDFTLHFENISTETVRFLGAEDKGYGGFNLRPDAKRKPMRFTTINGPTTEDHLSYDTPWVDVSFEKIADGEEAPEPSDQRIGFAVFQHPSNPGFPHPGWIMRHYSFLGASWPHEQTHEMAPGDTFTLRYRVFIHDGDAEQAGVADAFAAYVQEAQGE